MNAMNEIQINKPNNAILYFSKLESVSLNTITQISFDYDFFVIEYFRLLCSSYFFLTKPQYYRTALYQYKTY